MPGSRRLLTYRRLPDFEIPIVPEQVKEKEKIAGRNADDLNAFRKKVSQAIQVHSLSLKEHELIGCYCCICSISRSFNQVQRRRRGTEA
jgi:hypothetical protein